MQTYCSGCKSHTDNICPKGTNDDDKQKIKGKLRCADCMANKSFSDKVKHNSELEITVSVFNRLNVIKQNMLTYCIKYRKKTEKLI